MGEASEKLFQVSLIEAVENGTRYTPMFLVRAGDEESVYARLPLVGLNDDVKSIWDVSPIYAEIIQFDDLNKLARREVKKRGYKPA